MNTFFQPDQLAQLTAGALIVAALGMIYFILKVSVEAFTRLSQANTSANTQAFHASSAAFTEAVRTLKDAQEGQRMFYAAKLDDLRGEISQLRERVRDLEAENDRKDARITELERENGELRREVKRLQTRMGAAEESIA
jgi:peptidoglycan hydrolase CwlO-like protein